MDTNKGYIFWTSDPTILYKNDKYLDFIPMSKMTRVEQLNAITRFCIYFIILVIVLDKSDLWIHVPITIIIFVAILYYIFDYDTDGMRDELYRMKGISEETFDGNVPRGDNETDEIHSGFYDSDGKLNTGKYNGSKMEKKNKIKYSFEDYKNYKKSSCRKPTADNPFMNPTSNDFELEDPPEACNAEDDEIQDKIVNFFNEGLYRDVGDLFEKENSQRQFYTVPQMNPPDQTAFAKWLYGTDDICKVDQSKCLRYEDLRNKRGLPIQQGKI
jgi:hypothetical protein